MPPSRPAPAVDLALILAGGQGKRLRPLTERAPKPLLELREGYTILDKQLGDLRAAGVRRVVLLIGHLGELIEGRYGSSWNGIEVLYSREDPSRPLGTWGALRNAIEGLSLRGPALVMNGDVVTDADLRSLASAGGGHLVTMLAVPMRSPYGILEISGTSVVSFREKPVLPYYINGGAYYVSDLAELLEWGRDLGVPSSLEEDLFPRLASAGRLGARPEPDPEVLWRSVDSVKDLEELRSIYRSRVDGPWGHEELLASTSEFARRRLRLRAGATAPPEPYGRLEVVRVERGRVRIEPEGGEPVELSEGGSITLEGAARRSIAALRDSVLDITSSPGDPRAR